MSDQPYIKPYAPPADEPPAAAGGSSPPPPPPPEPVYTPPVSPLLAWGVGALLLVVVTAVNALMQRWLGPTAPVIQPPPGVLLVTPEGLPVKVQVVKPE